MQTKHYGRRPPAGPEGATALYERLPRGPHRLAPHEVAHHQRERIRGAIVAATAGDGYRSTTVAHVTRLAGVSRRSFYEHYRNKEDCFLSTLDTIVARWRMLLVDACSHGDSSRETLSAAGSAIADAVSRDQMAAEVLIVRARAAGRPALDRQRAAMVAYERVLAAALAGTPGGAALPPVVVRGIVGGMMEIAAQALVSGGPAPRELAPVLSSWALCFDGADPGFRERVAANLSANARGGRPTPRALPVRRPRADGDVRGRLLGAALRMALEHDYQQLSAPELADRAGVALEPFFDLFADRDDCYRAALDELAAELLAIASPGTQAGWPSAVRPAIAGLLDHLADQPVSALTLAYGALLAGESHGAHCAAIVGELARALVRDAPEHEFREWAGTGIAGAIWHTIGCQAQRGRLRLLPLLADQLCFVVLAPLIGAAEACVVAGTNAAACGEAVRPCT